MATKVKVGLIGTGMISKAYLKGLANFEIVDVAACADIDLERARAVAEEWHIPQVCTVEELLADPEIQLVLNLTIPQAHAPVSLAALEAGKHVYVEKPFAVTLEEGKRVLETAKARGLLTGCAPETFMGAGHQLCRKLIDEGELGEPVAAFASFAIHAEGGPPNRDFMFQRGGGPLLDMGPYYLTALVNMLGPVARVTGSTKLNFPEREVKKGPYQGRHVQVETPTHITGVLDFVSGAVATMVMSFDVHWGHTMPQLEVYGSGGALQVPDPNFHAGAVRIRRPGEEWSEVSYPHQPGYMRGLGIVDMAHAIVDGHAPRASGELAYHVLEIMLAFEQASTSGRHVTIESRPARPALVAEGELTA